MSGLHTETVYCIPGWLVIAWGSVTVILCTCAYYLGAWRGWKTRPVNFYTIAHCELSPATNFTRVAGCPLNRKDGEAAREAEHARRNDECAQVLEASMKKREGGEG